MDDKRKTIRISTGEIGKPREPYMDAWIRLAKENERMDDKLTVNVIRESRANNYWGSPVDDYRCVEAEQHVDFLLSEVDRLTKQVVAGKALADFVRGYSTGINADVRLDAAVAAYEQAVAESEGA